MDIRKFIGPDGMVELQTSDGKTIRRWPIDAKQMIASGGAKPLAAKSGGPAPVQPKPTEPTFSEDDG